MTSRVEYTAKTPKPGSGVHIAYLGDTIKVSYDRRAASGMALDALPHGLRQARDQQELELPTSKPRNPIKELVDLLKQRLDGSSCQEALGLLGEFVDLGPEEQTGQAQDGAMARRFYATQQSLEERFSAFSRLKSGW